MKRSERALVYLTMVQVLMENFDRSGGAWKNVRRRSQREILRLEKTFDDELLEGEGVVRSCKNSRWKPDRRLVGLDNFWWHDHKEGWWDSSMVILEWGSET